MSAHLSGDAILERLAALTGAMDVGRPFWSTRPFRQRTCAWEADHPDLASWCRTRSREQLFTIEQDPHETSGAPHPWPALVALTAPLIRLGPLPSQQEPDLPGRRHVRFHKWEQVRMLTGVALANLPADDGPVVEWCSGHGHLGRELARGRPLILLERDPALCRTAATLADPTPAKVHCVDVLDPPQALPLPSGALLAGLHACGTLTDALLDAGLAHGASAIIAAPCCLHRLVGVDHHPPRSTIGRQAAWRLDHDDLRVATRDVARTGARRTRLRARELLLRSAWDLLLREHSGQDRHHALPPMVRSRFDADLSTFLAGVARERGISLPAFNAVRLETLAAARVMEIRALELPRLLFRRAMELWVNLDRAASLVELGWTVSLGTFCPRSTTPRNLALLAIAPP